ncbi:DUF3440 domain-containing protein [Enterococcus faecium]|uniref:DUF3440 domain-containing protein n=1 Tax=Enterococcus faecium TaxID=1352 RepID=UPI003394E2C9
MSVLEAAIQRIRYILKYFDHICISLSGGKDSGTLIQLFNIEALKMNQTFDVMVLDIEANYTKTVLFQKKCEELEAIDTVYHFCLPFFEDNNSSIFQPQWMMWNPKEKEKWIQPMPKQAITVDNLPETLKKYFLKANGNPDIFLRLFSKWYSEIHKGEPVAIGIGIRTQESLNRYQAIYGGRHKYQSKKWINRYCKNIYNCYPIYDWKYTDIWGAVSQLDLIYNGVYDDMLRAGVKLSEMRICQPFGLVQRKGLDQYAILEPELWEKLVNRVAGANFGSLYSRTTILGYLKSSKPEHFTWQEYTVFLLETYGFYSPELRDHYYRKIKILMNYYEKKFNWYSDDMVEESTIKEQKKDERLWHTWKGIARALEKNDFALTSRSYSLTKKDEEELYTMYDHYHDILGIEELNKGIYQEVIKKLKGEG